MNPSPDRGKECLPPKKRESRQGSSELPLDEFKPPVPLRASDRALTNPNSHLLHTPPPLPAPAPGLPLPLPWHLGYSPSVSLPLPFPADSREMWSYMNSGRRDYSSSLFPSSYLFGITLSSAGEYGNDSSRLDISPHSTHANGARRQQENLSSLCPSGGLFLSESAAQEEPHSSLQDRHAHTPVKSSSSLLSPSGHPLGPDARTGRGELLDHLGVSTAEAQVYYSLGMSQNYPLYSPSGTPLYNLHRDPGPRHHTVRSTPHSPLGVSNNHDRLLRDREHERDKDKIKDKDKHLLHHKDQQRDSEPERRRDRIRARDSSPDRTHSSPPALLPHFTKGSLIELAGGRLKRVEELRTEDFLRSADTSPDLHLSTCKVLLISPSSTQGFSHLQVHLTDRNTQELLKVLVEYPFFVRDRGWSSCCPQKTLQSYGLSCRQLTEGDVCLALTPPCPTGHVQGPTAPSPPPTERTERRCPHRLPRRPSLTKLPHRLGNSTLLGHLRDRRQGAASTT
ncbi:hypothetical protein WMY93_030505 [Mugilogobius chulae]|uniref:AXH domain-containing protein n=1 Tax=Mugilogobius chulae TaxID=88201 RepID=A0AAW0MHM9_9GOBI